MTPSGAGEEEGARPAAAAGVTAALLRGALAHRLLQALPDLPPARRARAAADFLAKRSKELAEAQRKTIADEVMRLIDDARFAPLFLPGSRAEVPIVGKLTIGGKAFRVSGQIDRLAVTQHAVLIADFKTNRPSPRRIEDVPPAYVRQLALYRAVLAKLYPGRTIRAALIWTEIPDIMEVSAAALDAALTQVNPALWQLDAPGQRS